AGTVPVHITGITLSRFEIEAAGRRAQAAGVADRVRFEYGDYTDLSYVDGTFDAVLALESLQNAPDLPRAFAELYRVLRPGGRISFSDFSLESDAEPHRIARFLDPLGLGALAAPSGGRGYSGAAGPTVACPRSRRTRSAPRSP